MMRRLERFRADLQPVALAYLKILEHREVRADQTGLTVGITPGVAPLARSGVLECRRIEPLLAMPPRRRLQRNTLSHIRTRVAAGVGEVRPRRDGERIPGIKGMDAEDLPTVEQQLDGSLRIAREGKLIGVAHHKPVRDVVIRPRFLGATVPLVAEAYAVVEAQRSLRHFVDRLAPRIGAKEAQAVREALQQQRRLP